MNIKNILIVAFGNTGNEPEAIRQTLESFFTSRKQVQRGCFDSQVVRLDIIASRVVGWMFFRKFLRLCGQVGCMMLCS